MVLNLYLMLCCTNGKFIFLIQSEFSMFRWFWKSKIHIQKTSFPRLLWALVHTLAFSSSYDCSKLKFSLTYFISSKPPPFLSSHFHPLALFILHLFHLFGSLGSSPSKMGTFSFFSSLGVVVVNCFLFDYFH